MPSNPGTLREKNKKRKESRRLFRAGRVLGDGLGTFRDSVLGQLARKDEADSGLNLAGGDGRLLVVGSELRSLSSNALKNVFGQSQQRKSNCAKEAWEL